MLSNHDLTCGSVMAPALYKYDKTSVIGNLEELFNLSGEPNTFRQQAIEQSQDPHTGKLLEEVAAYVGLELRTSTERIKEHVVPTLKKIELETNKRLTSGCILEKTVSGLTIRYNCVDHSFFESALYPEGRSNTTLSYRELDLRTRFPAGMLEGELEGDVVKGFIVNHPDIAKFMSSEDISDWREAIENTHNAKWWADMFSADGWKCDFSRVRGYRLSAIFRVYVVLSKIRGTPDLIAPVQNISLQDYRLLINDLWEGLNVYLPLLRVMCDNHRQQGLSILSNSKFSLETRQIDGMKLSVMVGNCDVLYSTRYATHIENHNSSLGEVTYNYVLHIIENNGIPKLSANAFIGIGEGCTFGTEMGLTGLLRDNTNVYKDEIKQVIIGVTREVVRQKLLEMGIEKFDLNKFTEDLYISGGYVDKLSVEGIDVGSVIMNSDIGRALLGCLGYQNAGKLLNFTRNQLNENRSSKEALARAYAMFALDYVTRCVE